MSAKSGYIYNWWDEHGQDPFRSYLDDEKERRELESKIQVAINLAINRPSNDPLEPNQPLIDFANDLVQRYQKQPSLLWIFYRVAGLPDPLQLEKQRVKKAKEVRKQRRREEAYNRLSQAEKDEYNQRVLDSIRTSHSGHWQYHDDDCLCSRYFDDARCNRGGYIWSCCGSTSESSGGCYNASTIDARASVPLPGYTEEDDEEVGL